MDKELFRKVESRLYKHYKQLKIIENLKNRIVLWYKQQENIKKEIQQLKNLNLDVYANMGIDYSRDKIQSGGDGTSAAEKGTIKYIENLAREYRNTIRKILKTNARIREMEIQIQDMQFNLSMLNEECKRFVEWKYKECKSVEWIATEMYAGVRSTAYRKRYEIVEDIAHWSNMSCNIKNIKM